MLYVSMLFSLYLCKLFCVYVCLLYCISVYVSIVKSIIVCIVEDMKSPKEDYEIRKSVVSDPGTGEDLLNFLSFYTLVFIMYL